MPHATPHFVPSHVAVPFVIPGHATHDVPHDDVDRLLSQAPAQSCSPVPHAPASEPLPDPESTPLPDPEPPLLEPESTPPLEPDPPLPEPESAPMLVAESAPLPVSAPKEASPRSTHTLLMQVSPALQVPFGKQA